MLGFDAIGSLAMGQQNSNVIVAAAGTATGAGTASAVGTKVMPAVGTATGTGTATAVGRATFAGTGTATSAGTATAVGRSFFAAIGLSSGIGAGGAVGRSTAASAGTAATGLGTASAVGTGIKSANASTAAGFGTASATGVAIGTGNGAAAGNGTAIATGTAITAAVGDADGFGTANGVGSRVMPGVGTAAGVGSAAAISFYFDKTASVINPDADDTDGNWLNELGGTTLVPSIDEMVPTDADYIISSDRPASDICKLRLSNPSGAISAPLGVYYRFRKEGAATINFRVRLLEGTTEIAAWNHTDIDDQFITAAQILTAPQFASIVDPNNLFLELRASV